VTGSRGLRAVVAFATLACLALATTRAFADEEDGTMAAPEREVSPSGPRFGLRSGYAVPIGTAFGYSGAMTETISGYVPLRVDAGYRIARHFYVGADVQLATLVSKACPDGGSCSGSDIRAGVMVAYHLLPTRVVDPWLGVGMGYEWLSVSRTVDGATGDIEARGLELIDVELGADVRPSRSFRIGPVLSASVGRYTRIAINGTSTRDFEATNHAWVMVGLRGAFDL
jgi:hypothetical protein